MLTVGPSETVNFLINYKPLATGVWEGKAKFNSTLIGEFWFSVKLVCDEIKTETFKVEAAIGEAAEHFYKILN